MGLTVIFEWKSKHCNEKADVEYKKMTDQLDSPNQTVGSQADIISNSNGEIDNYLNLEKKSIYWKIGIDSLFFLYLTTLTVNMSQSAFRLGWVMVVIFGLLTLLQLFMTINNGLKYLNLFEQKKNKLLALSNFMTTMKNHPLFDPNLPVIDSQKNETTEEIFSNFPEDQAKIMQARHDFSLKYSEGKGWGGELSIEQILEIRNQKDWIKPV